MGKRKKTLVILMVAYVAYSIGKENGYIEGRRDGFVNGVKFVKKTLRGEA